MGIMFFRDFRSCVVLVAGIENKSDIRLLARTAARGCALCSPVSHAFTNIYWPEHYFTHDPLNLLQFQIKTHKAAPNNFKDTLNTFSQTTASACFPVAACNQTSFSVVERAVNEGGCWRCCVRLLETRRSVVTKWS